ncbi:ABC transporter permease [Falsiroseomonas bella]|uniref:ABC transporter permease n=1 Tax=Falsiroseomonas bella TaxID=2184016 RepID=A0A317FAK1_9PROT|nr:ABC transporter permease [Falsiroseomonas bella]PWS34508.1 ABC transporter permease [Falsiroseomonas bella]
MAQLSPLERWVLTLLGTIGFFAIWQGVAASGLVSHNALPTPAEVLATAWQLSFEPFAGHTLLQHLAASLGRFAMGFGLAALVGVPLGLAMGRWRLLDDIVSPIFEMLRFVAPLAWVPFAALWFGTGIGGPVMVIFAGALPPCLINAYRGAKLVEPRIVEAAQVLGASGPRIMAEVLLPGSLPSIVAGLRVSAGLAWQSLIGAELIVASAGIGYVMVQAQSNLAPSIVMAGMLAVGVIGLALDVALRRTETLVKARWGQA